jgi:hypothetical protein
MTQRVFPFQYEGEKDSGAMAALQQRRMMGLPKTVALRPARHYIVDWQ